MSIKEKLRIYCKYKGYSYAFFCGKIDVSDKFLSSNGRVYSDVLPKIRKVFTDLNMDWLQFDEGKMIKEAGNNDTSEEHKLTYQIKKDSELLEIYRENRALKKENNELKETISSLKKDNQQVSN